MDTSEQDRLRRWRLVLGGAAEANAKSGGGGLPCSLTGRDADMDGVLEQLYDAGSGTRRAGLGGSNPNVNRWLGDIRSYFPKSVVKVMQQDALTRLHLTQMLLEPEILETIEADVHLVSTLIGLKNVIPEKTKETARHVVRKVTDELEGKLANKMREAVRGALNKASRTNRPRAGEIDWDRTIRKNLKNYLPDRRTIIAERLVGYGRKRSSLRDIVLCIDQSGSMATSVVYSSIFAASLASLRAVTTKMVCFDTEIVDLTEMLADPVDVLFGTQLGGGTDINRAVGYCRKLITAPAKSIFVLITDLYEGGDARGLVKRMAELVSQDVTCVCLLALSDEGSPCYDERLAGELTALGVPCFACTPDLFPDLMATAINRRDINQWAAKQEIVVRGRPQN